MWRSPAVSSPSGTRMVLVMAPASTRACSSIEEGAAVDATSVETRGVGMELGIFARVVTEDDVRRSAVARGPGRSPLATRLARVRNGAEGDEMARVLVLHRNAEHD